MKIFTVLVSIIALSFVGFAQTAEEVPDACISSETKDKIKPKLEDFTYDASKVTKITFKDKPQLKELEIPLFMGEKYRFVFSKEGLPQDVDIEIWDNKYEAHKRELLFSSKDFPDNQVEYTWEPDKSRKMYLNYKIPPTSDVEKKGCVIFVLGYLTKGGKNE